ncbi:MAG: ribosome-associated translation inhibitor RaiA [Deltaproteobacteria bacterium]|jgi:putative sigma-54 modulation protein|nr:ribosome-associated translation inhibitor RaiA [Deltaproteobacteria bacterium]
MSEPLNILVTFRHTEPTEALRQHAIEKISHALNKYSIRDGVEISVTLSVEKRDHTAEVRVKSLGFDLTAKVTTEDLYSAIDQVIDPLEAQIRKNKDKQITAKHQA